MTSVLDFQEEKKGWEVVPNMLQGSHRFLLGCSDWNGCGVRWGFKLVFMLDKMHVPFAAGRKLEIVNMNFNPSTHQHRIRLMEFISNDEVLQFLEYPCCPVMEFLWPQNDSSQDFALVLHVDVDVSLPMSVALQSVPWVRLDSWCLSVYGGDWKDLEAPGEENIDEELGYARGRSFEGDSD